MGDDFYFLKQTLLSDSTLAALKVPTSLKAVPERALEFKDMRVDMRCYQYRCKNGYSIKADISVNRDGRNFYYIYFSVRDATAFFGFRGLTSKEAKELLNEEENGIVDASEGEVVYYMNLINKLPLVKGAESGFKAAESLYGGWSGPLYSRSTAVYVTATAGSGVWG